MRNNFAAYRSLSSALRKNEVLQSNSEEFYFLCKTSPLQAGGVWPEKTVRNFVKAENCVHSS